MTDLGCSCACTYDYEPADVYQAKEVKARKSHTCYECDGEIARGETHEVVSGLWDGSWSRYRTCLLCVRIRDDLCGCGFIFGALRETIREDFGFDYVTGEFVTSGWWKDRD